MGMQSLNSHSFLHFSSEAAEKTKGENSLNSFLHLLFLAMVITNKGEPLILRGQRQRHILVVKAFVDNCALGHGVFYLKILSLCPYVSGTTNIHKAFLFGLLVFGGLWGP
ncbi:hypothetical protein Lalb_Chr15g0087781 [Lupinus albus]|uniref:Uncharacterized protein n=1 Tax=Lupinus albus TaxID=3870 RepID=A0A6A4P2Z4_LUPAL|nr:hypothetical protein Lalb_Chr15g0087781 [Lupinus albus]